MNSGQTVKERHALRRLIEIWNRLSVGKLTEEYRTSGGLKETSERFQVL